MRIAVRIPYRIKILATVLVLVTTAVSIITFTMARMFHADKSTYVSDLAAVMAVHASEEVGIVLASHRDRMLEMAHVLDDPELTSARKRALVSQAFGRASGCVAVRIFEDGREIGSLADTLTGRTARQARAALAQPLLPYVARVAPGDVAVVPFAPPGLEGSLLGLLVSRPPVAGRPSTVLAAMLDTDQVFSPGGRSSAFDLFLADSSGRFIWHTDPAQVSRHGQLPILSGIDPQSRAVVRQYTLDGVEMIGGVSSVGVAGLWVGSQVPKAAALFASRQLLRDLIWVALLLLLGAALVSLLWSAQLTRTLSQLAGAAKLIGHGDFSAQVSVRSSDEMGDLARSFNQMASELSNRDRALREAQAQLVQSEKMAAFGQLGAGIAHEVKNPLAGIQGIVQLSARSLASDHPIAAHLEMIEHETKRCREIIDNLLKFARQEKSVREPTAIADVVRDTVNLMRHQMGLHSVELRTEIEPSLPLVPATANQLQQVLMNLLLNAEQAMESRGHGSVKVVVKRSGERFVEVRVEDDGPGIPEHDRARIFEPFFTTKPAGKGTGLGLSVTFGIVRDHGGSIDVESEMGRGTSFIIRLPIGELAPGVAGSSETPPTEEKSERQAA